MELYRREKINPLAGCLPIAIQIPVFFSLTFCLRMILSDLPSPAEASSNTKSLAKGFAQAGNRLPLFGITR